MTRIKFRAYHPELGMSEPFKLGDTNIVFNDTLYGLFHVERNPKHRIIQYTGFNDKNGKEIYEWDIIYKYDITYLIEDDNGIILACGKSNNTPDVPLCDLNLSKFKIIGNNYENPELLD